MSDEWHAAFDAWLDETSGFTLDDEKIALVAFRDGWKAALNTCADGGWRPIETAPKDGTRVIICCADGIRDTAFWSDSVWCSPGGAWVNDVNRSDTYEFTPTHWQPLPQPPAEKDE